MSERSECPACGTARSAPDEAVCAVCGHGEKVARGRGMAIGIGLIVLLLVLGVARTMLQ